MKTLSITEGRGRLGYWLKKAVEGEDVGFVVGNRIIALRPVEVTSADYALQEYGLTPAEMAKVQRRIVREVRKERKQRQTRRFTGGEDDFR